MCRRCNEPGPTQKKIYFLLFLSQVAKLLFSATIGHFNAIVSHYINLLLGAFAKRKRVSGSSRLSVCPSVARNNSDPTGRIFMEFHTRNFHYNLLTHCNFDSNRWNITDTLHANLLTFMTVLWFLMLNCCEGKRGYQSYQCSSVAMVTRTRHKCVALRNFLAVTQLLCVILIIHL
jgi:hypothetical protein